MDKYFNLDPDLSLSNACIAKQLTTFDAVFNYIKQLPYGRTTDRSDFTLVLKEKKGTCSTKHAFLKAIALENNFQDLELYLGIFEMNALHTPKIKSILDHYGLTNIPEAHCYLKLNNKIIDVTFPKETHPTFIDTLILETSISPKQIGAYKLEFHQSYLKSWIKTENLPFSLDEIWSIREDCIKRISE